MCHDLELYARTNCGSGTVYCWCFRTVGSECVSIRMDCYVNNQENEQICSVVNNQMDMLADTIV